MIKEYVVKSFQWFLNASLILLGMILSVIMVREILTIVSYAIQPTLDVHNILQDVLMFFLFFAFLSTVVKYFKEDYHFPIRYLLYIGITATLRFIIVNRDNPYENLILAVVILVLMVSYTISRTPRSDG